MLPELLPDELPEPLEVLELGVLDADLLDVLEALDADLLETLELLGADGVESGGEVELGL